MDSDIRIEIQYRLQNDAIWKVMKLSPCEYFDLEEGETIEVDCIPIFNNTLEYISEGRELVVDIKTTIIDNKKNDKRIFLETYWNKQQNFIIERIDEIGELKDSEIIIESVIQENPKVTEILRLVKKDGILTPVLHSLITNNDDGSQSENQIV